MAALERERLLAVGHADTPTLERLLSDDFVVTFGNGMVQTRAQMLARLKQRPPEVAAGITELPEQMTIRVYGSTAAVVTGLVVVRFTNSAPAQSARFTSIWIRQGPGWRIVATHVNEAKA